MPTKKAGDFKERIIDCEKCNAKCKSKPVLGKKSKTVWHRVTHQDGSEEYFQLKRYGEQAA